MESPDLFRIRGATPPDEGRFETGVTGRETRVNAAAPSVSLP